MSATKTTAANVLSYSYDRVFIADYERFTAKFWTSLNKFPDGGPALGTAKNWSIQKAGSQAAAVISEGGNYPTDSGDSYMQASITPVEIAATCAMTELVAVIAQKDGYLGEGTSLAQARVKTALKQAVQTLNRQSLGWSSGRMGVVNGATDTSTTVPLQFPQGAFQFRENQEVELYDTDSAGSIQGAAETVTFVSQSGPSPYIVIDTARTLTDGWGIYRAGEYGISMQGLQQWVDDGTLTASVGGITRSSNPEINAAVYAPSAGLQPFSEQLIDQAINETALRTGVTVDEIWCNQGIPSAHRNSVVGSRIFQQSPTDGPSNYRLGYNTDQLFYTFNGKNIGYKVDNDLPARNAYGITKGLFRRFITKELDWTGDGMAPDGGSGSPVWMQLPATTTYSSAKICLANAFVALGHTQPKTNFLVSKIVDNLLASDTL